MSVPILGYQRPATSPPVMSRAERDARPKPMSKKNLRVARGVFGAIAARKAERAADALEAAAAEVD